MAHLEKGLQVLLLSEVSFFPVQTFLLQVSCIYPTFWVSSAVHEKKKLSKTDVRGWLIRSH